MCGCINNCVLSVKHRVVHRSAYVYRARFNLEDLRLIKEDGDELAPAAPALAPSPFLTAWRNYLKLSVFQTGFMYRLAASPTYVYVVENKTLAGREDRSYEGEAVGRKLSVVFFESKGEDLVQRVDRSRSAGLSLQLLNVAELVQTLGVVALPPDPDRSAADSELLYELAYRKLEGHKYKCTVEPAAGVHVYMLHDEGTELQPLNLHHVKGPGGGEGRWLMRTRGGESPVERGPGGWELYSQRTRQTHWCIFIGCGLHKAMLRSRCSLRQST